MIQLDVSHSFDKPICIIFYYLKKIKKINFQSIV